MASPQGTTFPQRPRVRLRENVGIGGGRPMGVEATRMVNIHDKSEMGPLHSLQHAPGYQVDEILTQVDQWMITLL